MGLALYRGNFVGRALCRNFFLAFLRLPLPPWRSPTSSPLLTTLLAAKPNQSFSLWPPNAHNVSAHLQIITRLSFENFNSQHFCSGNLAFLLRVATLGQAVFLTLKSTFLLCIAFLFLTLPVKMATQRCLWCTIHHRSVDDKEGEQ